MASRKSIAGTAFAAILLVAATVYVFATPYNRIAGVRIGGTLTPPPEDFTTAYPRRSACSRPGVPAVRRARFTGALQGWIHHLDEA